MFRNILTAGLVSLALAGCVAPVTGGTQEEVEANFRAQVRTACTGYATILVFFAHNLDRMSEEAKISVSTINDIVKPVCLDINAITNYEQALVTVQDALIRLQFERTKLDGN